MKIILDHFRPLLECSKPFLNLLLTLVKSRKPPEIHSQFHDHAHLLPVVVGVIKLQNFRVLQLAHDRHFSFDILSFLLVDGGYEFGGQLFARFLLGAMIDDAEFTYERDGVFNWQFMRLIRWCSLSEGFGFETL